MKNVLGIIFSNMHDHMIKELTTNRCMGSLPVGGRYRLIDFVLSGFANASITNTIVITKSNYKSLLDHLGNGREWDLARKRGGLMFLPPAAISDAGDLYRSRIDAFNGIMSIIKDLSAEHVLIADSDAMANIDFADFIDFHRRSKADATVMYKKQYMDGRPTRDMATFTVDEQDNITDMLLNPEVRGEQNGWLNIIIIKQDVLEWVIRDCVSRSLTSFERDVMQANLGNLNFKGYEFEGHAYRFDSMIAYYESNLALLEADVRHDLFPTHRPIYTSVWDEAPVRYGLDAKVENSMLADGCLIEGEVENSLLSRGVYVGKGAKVTNSVLMQGTYVGPYSTLRCVITDKRVIIKENRSIMGHETYPMYIAKGSIV